MTLVPQHLQSTYAQALVPAWMSTSSLALKTTPVLENPYSTDAPALIPGWMSTRSLRRTTQNLGIRLGGGLAAQNYKLISHHHSGTGRKDTSHAITKTMCVCGGWVGGGWVGGMGGARGWKCNTSNCVLICWSWGVCFIVGFVSKCICCLIFICVRVSI